MTATKQVFYDTRSLDITEGDEVQILVKRNGEESEELTAIYFGVDQVAPYTTPYFRFVIDGKARLINANDVREFRFTLSTPETIVKSPALPGVGSSNEYDWRE